MSYRHRIQRPSWAQDQESPFGWHTSPLASDLLRDWDRKPVSVDGVGRQRCGKRDCWAHERTDDVHVAGGTSCCGGPDALPLATDVYDVGTAVHEDVGAGQQGDEDGSALTTKDLLFQQERRHIPGEVCRPQQVRTICLMLNDPSTSSADDETAMDEDEGQSRAMRPLGASGGVDRAMAQRHPRRTLENTSGSCPQRRWTDYLLRGHGAVGSRLVEGRRRQSLEQFRQKEEGIRDASYRGGGAL